MSMGLWVMFYAYLRTFSYHGSNILGFSKIMSNYLSFGLHLWIDPFPNDVEYVWKRDKWCDSLLSKNPSSYHYANSTTTKQITRVDKSNARLWDWDPHDIEDSVFLEEFQKNWRHRENWEWPKGLMAKSHWRLNDMNTKNLGNKTIRFFRETISIGCQCEPITN